MQCFTFKYRNDNIYKIYFGLARHPETNILYNSIKIELHELDEYNMKYYYISTIRFTTDDKINWDGPRYDTRIPMFIPEELKSYCNSMFQLKAFW